MPVPVIMYHRVLPFKCELAITISEFESQLAFLHAKGFKSLSAKEFFLILQGGKIPDRAVVITFDDGYRDNWYLAGPILKKYGMHALLFIITARVKDIANSIEGDWSELGEDVYLTWDEIHSMSESGIFEIHSHTHSHKKLWEVGSASDIWKSIANDISLSVNKLKEQGFTYPIHMAWPWGYFEHGWLDDAVNSGVVTLYSCQVGTNFSGQGNKLIRRINGEKLNSYIGLKLFFLRSAIFGFIINCAQDFWIKIRGRF